MCQMPRKESENLVEALKKWAIENGKKQSEVASILNVDRERVSKWFAGTSVPSLEHGLKIIRLLKEKRRSKK
jgi:transcriptional regulator with XRE-family HTH domain